MTLAIVSDLSEDLDVLFVKYLDEDGNPAAEAKAVMVWPNMTNSDWETFVDTNIVISVVNYLGVPYAMQLPRWDIQVPPVNVLIGDCDF